MAENNVIKNILTRLEITETGSYDNRFYIINIENYNYNDGFV